MLKKIIIAGLVIIALLGALLLRETFKQRGEPTRPDSLINKEDLGMLEGFGNFSTDTNETNETMTEVDMPVVKKENKPKQEQLNNADNGSYNESSLIDENNNIYTNDESSKSTNDIDNKEEATSQIDTTLKESLSDIRSKVEGKINSSSALAGSSISVSTGDKGIVLNGTVTSAKQKILAGSIANSASENATVANRITVEAPKPVEQQNNVEVEKPKEPEASTEKPM